MDEAHLIAAFRNVAMNPVKPKWGRRPLDWPWSSTPPHLAGRDDARVNAQPLLARVDEVAQFLSGEAAPALEQRLVTGQSIRRPLLDYARLAVLEKQLQRGLRTAPRGRPRKARVDSRKESKC
ncbi:MAG: hypothetical protein L0H73_05080 [Nitrococcus sp.]|nr:hypothetical protein [Nitrococcus sp.]